MSQGLNENGKEGDNITKGIRFYVWHTGSDGV